MVKRLIITVLFFVQAPVLAMTLDMNYSGRVVMPTGAPMQGPVSLRVKFYRDLNAVSEIPGVTIPDFLDVPLVNGIFSLDFNLSSSQLHQIFDETGNAWIEITDLTNNKIYPRQRYNWVPYALKVPTDTNVLEWGSDGLLTIKPGASGQVLKTDNSGQLVWAEDETISAGSVSTSSIADDAVTNDKIAPNAVATPEIADGAVTDAKVAVGINASKISTGSLPDSVIPSTIARDSEIPSSTDGLTEGTTNRYFANSLARAAFSAGTPLSYNQTTGAFSLQASSNSQDGYLSSTDFSVFNGKQDALSGNSNLTLSSLTANTDIVLNDDDASASVTLKARDSLTGSYTLTLPDNNGDPGQILSTDGSGLLSWSQPSIADGAVTNVKVAAGIDAAKVGVGTVSNTEFGYLDGVTGAVQTQISGKVSVNGDTMSGPLSLPVNGLAVGTDQLIAANGGIGIGTDDPQAALDVVGDIAASGGLHVSGNADIGGNIKISDNSAACAVAADGGRIRYHSGSGSMQYCNGLTLAWVNMGSAPTLGAWQTGAGSTVYTAPNVGYVTAWANMEDDEVCQIYGYTDTNVTPNTLVIFSEEESNDDLGAASITMPVRAGDNWRVVFSNYCTNRNVRYIYFQ